MIKTIIVEDEKRNRDALQKMLQQFTDIELLAVCKNAEEGKTAIKQHKPDLLLSDIELEKDSAFNMLQQVGNIDFEVIFTTAYEKYAIQAIKFSALDYLLKPFSASDLEAALNQYREKLDKKQSANKFDVLFHNLKQSQEQKKIVLPTTHGLMILPVKEIIRCESDVNYTNFFLVNKNKLLVSKTLKDFEEMLSDFDFIRIHGSHLINLHHVKNYTRGEGGYVTMDDGSEVEVSRRKKDEFMKKLAEL